MRRIDNGNFYFPNQDGQWVSQKQMRTAEILKEYDPNLQLQWIPPGERSSADLAFRVVDFRPGFAPYAVCFAEEADERLLAKIFAGDNHRNGGNTLNYLEAHNAAVEAMRRKEAAERNAEANEFAYAVLHSQKYHYKHGGFDYGKLGG